MPGDPADDFLRKWGPEGAADPASAFLSKWGPGGGATATADPAGAFLSAHGDEAPLDTEAKRGFLSRIGQAPGPSAVIVPKGMGAKEAMARVQETQFTPGLYDAENVNTLFERHFPGVTKRSHAQAVNDALDMDQASRLYRSEFPGSESEGGGAYPFTDVPEARRFLAMKHDSDARTAAEQATRDSVLQRGQVVRNWIQAIGGKTVRDVLAPATGSLAYEQPESMSRASGWTKFADKMGQAAGAALVMGGGGAALKAPMLVAGAYGAAHAQGAIDPETGKEADPTLGQRALGGLETQLFMYLGGKMTPDTAVMLKALPAGMQNVVVKKALDIAGGIHGFVGSDIVTKALEGKSIDAESATFDAVLGGILHGVGGKRVEGIGKPGPEESFRMRAEASAAEGQIPARNDLTPKMAARVEATKARSAAGIADENAMLATSLPRGGVTPDDTMRAAQAQADAVHEAATEGAEGARRVNAADAKRRRGISAFSARMVEKGVGSTEDGPRLMDVLRQRFPDLTPDEARQAILDLHESGAIDTDRASREMGLQWGPGGPRPMRGVQGQRPQYVKKGEPVERIYTPPWEQVVARPFVGLDPAAAAGKAAAEAAARVEVPYAVPESGGPVGEGHAEWRAPSQEGVSARPGGNRQGGARAPGEQERRLDPEARGEAYRKGRDAYTAKMTDQFGADWLTKPESITKEDMLAGHEAAIKAQEAAYGRAIVGGGSPPKRGLVVANIGPDGKVYYGEPGDTHFDVTKRHDLEGTLDEGFAAPDGKFLTRKEALSKAEEQGTKVIPSRANRGGLEARDYNKAQEEAYGRSMRRVGAVSPEDAALATGLSQRGAVSGSPATARERMAQAWDSTVDRLGRTRRFVQSKILEPAFGKDPESAEIVGRGAGVPQAAIDRATKMMDKATSGWSAADRRRFDFAYSDAQNEKNGHSAVGTPLFNRAFPGGLGEYARFKDGQVYKDAAKEARGQFEQHVRPVNERAGVKGDISALEGPNGEFSNLIPLDTDEAKVAGRGGQRVTFPSGRGLSGPSVPRSQNARQRVGGADSYDYSVRNQFARALGRNGDIANRLDIVDSMTRNGTFVKAEKGAERPEGYVQATLDMGKGMKAGAENEVSGHVVGWVAPEFVSPLRARFKQGFVSEEAGAGSALKQAGVATQLFVNPAVGIGHIGFNVAPRVAWNALTSPLAAGKGAALFVPRAVRYMADPVAHADARLRLTEDTGQARDAHQKSTVPWIGRAADAAGRVIDAFDTAGRQAIDEFVKSKQASGAAKPGFQARHEAQLRLGQYSNLLQDTTTKAWKAWLNPFVVIGKASVDNVFSTFPGLSQGFQAANGKARVAQAARVAAVIGAYAAYKMVLNYQKSGEIMPAGMPTMATYDGRDPKTGAPLWHWSLLDNLLMIPRIMSWTPAAAIDPIREHASAAKVALAPVVGLTKAATHVMNYWPRVVEKLGREAGGADLSKLEAEFPALKDVLSVVEGDSMTDTFLPQTGLKVGKSAKQLEDIAHPERLEAERVKRAASDKSLKEAMERAVK